MSQDRNSDAGRLAGRVAIVTGAAGDIGAAIMTRYRAAGATAVGFDQAAAETEAGPILACDVADERQVNEAVGIVAERFGPATILVNNAAAPTPVGTVCTLSIADWDRSIAVNLTGAFLMCRATVPGMQAAGGGVIINVASQLGHVATPGRAVYSATKAALHSLTRTLALDHAADGIRAVSLSPGAVLTGRIVRQSGGVEEAKAAFGPLHPIGRLGTADEIAAAALFLASDDAAFITGSDMLVDGGYTAR